MKNLKQNYLKDLELVDEVNTEQENNFPPIDPRYRCFAGEILWTNGQRERLQVSNVFKYHSNTWIQILLISAAALIFHAEREETCGGLGMSKYIDSNETRRLSRLKNVKSSIGNKISHNGWLKRQIEKRRMESLRQRKEEAKRKPLGDGIQVDTKVSRSDAVSKCGLKLKGTKEKEEISFTHPSRRTTAVENRAAKLSSIIVESPHLKLLDKPSESLLIPAKKKFTNFSSTSRPPNANDPPIVKRFQTTIKQTGRPSRNKDKENNCLQAKSTTINESTSKYSVKHEGEKKKGSTKSKKYFRDIDSLKREHANAIRMLEELDINEGKKRRHSVSGNDRPSGFSIGDYDVNNSSDDEMQKSSMHACSDDYIAMDDEFTCEERSVTGNVNRVNLGFVNESECSVSEEDCTNNGCVGMHEQREYHADFVMDQRASICSSGSCSSSSTRSFDSSLNRDFEENICASSVVRGEEAENALSDNSFLNNMTHLSISLRDEFDNEGENNEEQVEENLGEYVASPI